MADLTRIEEARLGARETFLAQTVCTSLYFLRRLAEELGKPMNAITMEDVLTSIRQLDGS